VGIRVSVLKGTTVRPFPTAHVGIQNRMVYLQNFGSSFIFPSFVNGDVLLIARCFLGWIM
jgi:hypothetical protein